MSESIFETDKARIVWQLKCVVAKAVNEDGQKAVAEILGVKQANLSRAMNPEYKPKIDTLIEWVKKLGFEVQVTY